MKPDLTKLTFLLLLSACHGSPPEGVYPCHSAADCPSVWVCRDDGLCWIHPLPPDAGTDSGTNCVAETCNGHDDDCDGLIDEGVLSVGPAVSADPTTGSPPNYFGALIVPTTTGFVVFGSSNNMATSGGWSTLDLSGTVTQRVPSATPSAFIDAFSVGDQVLASGTGTSGGVSGLGLLTFDFAVDSMPRAFLAIGNGTDDVRFPLIGGFDGHYATLYEAAYSTTSEPIVRRAVIDVGAQSTVSDGTISTDVSTGSLGVVSTRRPITSRTRIPRTHCSS